jgi:hypothetical protein
MNRGCQYLAKQVSMGLLLLSLVATSTALAERTRRDDASSESRTSEKDVKKEQMRQEASKSFPELSDALTGILKKVAINQPPEQSAIEQARQLLDENKRNGWAYDDTQKAEYMLLQAWTGFYEDNPMEAVNWSMRAAKADPASGDAWVSQGLFCMLNGKRPMAPRIKKEKPKRRNDSGNGGRTRRPRRKNNEGMMPSEMNISSTEPYGQKGNLEFDMSALRSEMLKKRFARCEYQAVDGSIIEYVPGQDTLCILFWQTKEMTADANDVPDDDEPQSVMGVNGMMPFGSASTSQMKFDVEGQRKYMKQMSEACKDNEQIKFLQINTNRLDTAEKVALELAGDSSIEDSGPLIFAAEPASGAEDYIGMKAVKPFVLIVDKEGFAKYAGPAADFMPAFILTELTGIQIDLQEKEQVPQPGQMDPRKANGTTPFSPMMMGYPPPVMTPDKTPAPSYDPNKPVAVPVEDPVVDANAPPEPKPAPKTAPKADEHQDFPTQSLEDQIRAEKLLQSAQMHIEESRKLRMKNPKQGIEDAREVLKQFPNTEYAQKARDLLRRVPDRWKTQHNITDEELGY